MQSIEKDSATKDASVPPSPKTMLRSWLPAWEVYGIFVVAAFLRFFQLQTTEFDTDQADLFRMAHDAVAYGMFPLTSNTASINILYPPGYLFSLMPAAALSAHPLGGALTVGLFSTAAALLTYFFTLRYFGRLAAIITTLLSITATVPLKYSRGIWQPNILPFFTLLFLFCIYRGAIERRRNWFLPAMAVFVIMYQLHTSALALGVLVVLALIMAPGTVRWRELLWAALAGVILLSPYLLWEVLTRFSEVKGLIAFSQLPAKFDSAGLTFYRQLLYPDNGFFPRLTHLWTRLIDLLLLAGVITGFVLLLQPSGASEWIPEAGSRGSNALLHWWNALRADRMRSSVLILLVWQIVPLVYISHHAVPLHMQYLLLFLPGPYILIALFLSQLIVLMQRSLPRLTTLVRIGVIALAALLICEQFVASTAYIVRMSGGHYDDRHVQNLPYVNDLNSLMHAFSEADQLAQARHLNRVYVTMDANVQSTMTYLGEQMKTPTTVFNADSCLALPARGAGPAVMLVGPYADLANTLVQQYASATLVDQPSRLGGKPFRLYIVEPRATMPLPSAQANFSGPLSLLTSTVQPLETAGTRMLTTHWQIQRSAPTEPRVLYNYALDASLATGEKTESGCALTSLRQGDQLITALHLSPASGSPGLLSIQGLTFDRVPYERRIGPVTVTAAKTEMVNWQHLRTAKGDEQITLSLPRL